MADGKEELRWYQRYTTARALDRMGQGWPERTREEQNELFRTRSQSYLKLMLAMEDEQLELLQEYAETLRTEQDFWNQRCFYLGFRAAMEEKHGGDQAGHNMTD